MTPPPHASTTGTRTRVRPHALLPDRHSWIDIGFTLALAGVALSAFGTSFTGVGLPRRRPARRRHRAWWSPT